MGANICYFVKVPSIDMMSRKLFMLFLRNGFLIEEF